MVKIRKLNCGATMIMEQTDYLRSAALGVWVKTGARNETPEVYGVSHFIEHMMFKGTDTRTAKQIAEDVDRIGGSTNAFTGKEATCYYIKTLSSNILKGAEIIVDMLTNSQFDQAEMDKERQVILEEIKMTNDSPDDCVFDLITELVSCGNPMGNVILGTPESLAGINRDELYKYYKDNYTNDKIVIAVAGNFDEESLAALFEEKLSVLGPAVERTTSELKPYVPSVQVKVKDIEQTNICLAVPAISLCDDRYYAFTLMNNIFGGSMSSRLFQNIREQKGLAYAVTSMNFLASDSGFFNIYAGVAHDKIQDTMEAIAYELNEIKTKLVDEDELNKAKEQVKSAYIFGLENVNSRMFSLGKNMLLLDKVFSPEEVISGYDAVTREDVLEAARLIGDIEQYCGAAVTGEDFDLAKMLNGGKN